MAIGISLGMIGYSRAIIKRRGLARCVPDHAYAKKSTGSADQANHFAHFSMPTSRHNEAGITEFAILKPPK